MANGGLFNQRTYTVKNSKNHLNNFIMSVSRKIVRERNFEKFWFQFLADLLEAQIKLAQQQCMNTLQACSTVAAQFIHFNKGKNGSDCWWIKVRVYQNQSLEGYVRGVRWQDSFLPPNLIRWSLRARLLLSWHWHFQSLFMVSSNKRDVS